VWNDNSSKSKGDAKPESRVCGMASFMRKAMIHCDLGHGVRLREDVMNCS
jgi:hypothetical protein